MEDKPTKAVFGRDIHKSLNKYGIHEATIPIEYQGPLEIDMKENEYHQASNENMMFFSQTDESNFVANSDQSETTLFEETVFWSNP